MIRQSRAGYYYRVEIFKPEYVNNEKLVKNSVVNDVCFVKEISSLEDNFFNGQIKQLRIIKELETKDNVDIKTDYFIKYEGNLYIVDSVRASTIKRNRYNELTTTNITVRRATYG